LKLDVVPTAMLMSEESYPATLPAENPISLPSEVVTVTFPLTLLATAVVALNPVAPLILETISSTVTALTFEPVNVTGMSAAPLILILTETFHLLMQLNLQLN